MRYLLFLASLWTFLGDQQEQKKAREFPDMIETFSPKSNLSLALKHGSFVLEKNEFSFDQISSTEITTGSYSIDGDVMTLKGKNDKKYTLRIETQEILAPIHFDTLTQLDKFLAWKTFYKNGNIKQSGGWTDNNEKDGVWTFYNENGKTTNQKLYDKGKLLNDNFRFDNEK